MADPARIQPRTLKGFRDYPPELALPRERLIEVAREVYRSFGFSPIDTPALEYAEILLGKGGAESDKQLYRFADHGGRDVALRFDLTVPFARFAAQHIGQLGTPFKRYAVGPVWRGENPQAGRYREFLQCDFDVIGSESLMADAEIALVIDALFARLPLAGRFRVRLNNRKVLTGFLEALSLSHASVEVLRCIDKLEKVGRAAVEEELGRLDGVGAEEARRVVDFAELGQVRGDDLAAHNEALLEALTGLVADSELGRRGVEELRGVRALALAGGVPEERLQLDPSIARGLDYYTGTVYETFLDDLPGIGSCCSGGRYDDLASLYTKERLPGVGASLGLDRLLTALDELGRVEHRSTAAAVFVPFFDADRGPDYLALAARLRAAGLGVELYPEPRKLKAQLKYADRRGHRLAVIVGGEEWARGVAQLKDLGTQQSEEVALDDLAEACARRLGPVA